MTFSMSILMFGLVDLGEITTGEGEGEGEGVGPEEGVEGAEEMVAGSGDGADFP